MPKSSTPESEFDDFYSATHGGTNNATWELEEEGLDIEEDDDQSQ